MSTDQFDVRNGRQGQAEPDLRHVVDAIPAQVWRATSDGAIDFVNQQWVDYTGLRAEQSQGWASSSSTVIRREDLPGLLDMFRRQRSTTAAPSNVPAASGVRSRNRQFPLRVA